MRRLLRSRLLVFTLLLAVGVGSVVSVVQAGQMRVDMATAGDTQGASGDNCTACGPVMTAQRCRWIVHRPVICPLSIWSMLSQPLA